MKQLRIIPVLGMIVFLVTGCGNFGFVKHPTEGYTTHYNYPGTRIAPYNNPELDNREIPDPDETPVCSGVPSKEGFQCTTK